jgi:hypothetical protein
MTVLSSAVSLLQRHEVIHSEFTWSFHLPYATEPSTEIPTFRACRHPILHTPPTLVLSSGLWFSSHSTTSPIVSRICLSCLRLRNPLWRIRTSLRDFLSGLGRYRHYRSLAEEQKWWDESARTRAFFASSDARHGRVGGISAHGCLSPVPLITSYVPRLLPAYRDHSGRRVDDAASERELTPSVYQKWHRLVYPHEVRPSTLEKL